MSELHPTGTFEATVINHGYNYTSKAGALYFWAEFQTEEGEVAGRFMMTGRAISHTLKKIHAMGFRGKDLQILQEGELLKGKPAQITVEHETYDGKTRAAVGFVNPHGFEGPGHVHNEAAAQDASGHNAEWARIRAELEGDNTETEDVPF